MGDTERLVTRVKLHMDPRSISRASHLRLFNCMKFYMCLLKWWRTNNLLVKRNCLGMQPGQTWLQATGFQSFGDVLD